MVETLTLHCARVAGMTVTVVPMPSLRGVHARLAVAAGSGDDPPGAPGLAHLCEHERIAMAASTVPSEGLRLTGVTDAGVTRFSLAGAADEWPSAVDRMAALLARGSVPPDRLRAEINAVRVELSGLSASTRLGPLLAAAALPGSDVARLSEATVDSVGALSGQDVVAFLDAHYRAGHARLVVVGPVPPDEVFYRIDSAAAGLRSGSSSAASEPPTTSIAPVPELSGVVAATLVRAAAPGDDVALVAADIARAIVTEGSGLVEASTLRHGRRVTGAARLVGRRHDLSVLGWGRLDGDDPAVVELSRSDYELDDALIADARRRTCVARSFDHQRASGLADQILSWSAGVAPGPAPVARWEDVPLDQIRDEVTRLLASLRVWRIVDGVPVGAELN